MSGSAEVYVRDISDDQGYFELSGNDIVRGAGTLYPRRSDRSGFVSAPGGDLARNRPYTRTRSYGQPKQVKTLFSAKELENYGLRFFADRDADEWIIGLDADDLVGAPKSTTWYSKLVSRIDELKQIAAEEELPFSPESAIQAKDFARNIAAAVQPSAFLVGNGNVRLLWTQGVEQIGLQFLPDEHAIQYVMFAKRAGRTSSHMGSDDSSTILRQISALGLRHLLGA